MEYKAILLCFEALFGLKVSFFKSKVLDMYLPDGQLKDLTDILGCRAGSFPST